MFSFPVSVPCRTDESIFPLVVNVAIDDIAFVKPLLDNEPPFGVESASVDLIPQAEIVFVDGRRLPVLEQAHIIFCYLDAYTALEDFYTEDRSVAAMRAVEEAMEGRDNVIPLFKDSSCATSEASTPD